MFEHNKKIIKSVLMALTNAIMISAAAVSAVVGVTLMTTTLGIVITGIVATATIFAGINTIVRDGGRIRSSIKERSAAKKAVKLAKTAEQVVTKGQNLEVENNKEAQVNLNQNKIMIDASTQIVNKNLQKDNEDNFDIDESSFFATKADRIVSVPTIKKEPEKNVFKELFSKRKKINSRIKTFNYLNSKIKANDKLNSRMQYFKKVGLRIKLLYKKTRKMERI